MTLRTRLVGALLLTALLPLLVVGVIAAFSARDALETRANDQLVAIRAIKGAAIESYFDTVRDQTITLAANPAVVAATRDFRAAFARYAEERAAADPSGARNDLRRYYGGEFGAKYSKENDDRAAPDASRLIGALSQTGLLLQHEYIARNRNPLGSKHQLDVAPDGTTYADVHRRIHPSLRQFVERFGYYDIFLVDAASGDVIYSMYKELDFATNLNRGAWSRSGLADAYRAALRQPKDGFAIVDYRTYTPSYEAPAGFSSTPIFDGGRRIGVLIFQLPLDRISQVMSNRSGLGESGETFLVGPDNLMRSDSFLDKENRSVIASFRHPEKGRVDTTSTKAAVAGDSGVALTSDYRGSEVLSAYQPVDVAGLRWVLLAEMDSAEAFADVASLTNTMLLVGAIAAGLIAAFGWWFAQSVARPMQHMAAVMGQVQRDGDYSRRTNSTGQDEIAQTGRAIDGLLEQLQRVFGAANGALAELAAGRFESHIDTPCQGALAELSAGINNAISGVADATRLQNEQAAELARNAEAQREQAEQLSVIAAENTRVRQALDCVSTGAMIADDSNRIVYTNRAVEALLRSAERDLRQALPAFHADRVRGESIDVFHRDPQHQRRMLAGLQQTHRTEITVGGRVLALIATPILADGKRLGTVVEWADRTQERAIEKEIQTLVDAASAGDFSARIAVDGKAGFFATLSEGLNALLGQVGGTIHGATQVLDHVSRGELTHTMDGEFGGTFAVLQSATNTTITRLTETIQGIGEAADSVFVAAGELAESASALRTRTEEQNAALESSASSITELTESVKATAESATLGSQLAKSARDQAMRGNEVVGATVQAMEEISRTSAQIEEFTTQINEIAFQTNLLALNAAVEAARAGEQGKGFAVVAGEVRNLAHRAGDAAKQIGELIRSSTERVQEGTRMATLSGQTLSDVIAAFERVNQTIAEVSSATNEQAANIEQVAQTVADLESMTQQNAAAVEESSAAAESVADQARQVRELLAFFQTSAKASAQHGRSARTLRPR